MELVDGNISPLSDQVYVQSNDDSDGNSSFNLSDVEREHGSITGSHSHFDSDEDDGEKPFQSKGFQDSEDDGFIRFLREELSLLSPSHPAYCMRLTDLAEALIVRGRGEDLNEGISLHQEALVLLPRDEPVRLMSIPRLANALIMRLGRTGASQDLEDAIVLYREEVRLSSNSSSHFTSLSNLADALVSRFRDTENREDLDEAVQLCREALTMVSANHRYRSEILNHLADFLHFRFEKYGLEQGAADLDEAIVLYRESLALLHYSHPNRSVCLTDLANVVLIRFLHLGRSDDLEEAIQLHREALVLRPENHLDRSVSLNNLASALRLRFKELGWRQEDSDEAVSLHRQALFLIQKMHPSCSASLNNLANALITRFERLGAWEDLDEGIALFRESLGLLPPLHPSRSMTINNLANALFKQFEQVGKREELDEATELFREAIASPGMHLNILHSASGHPMPLNNLANALLTRFEHFGEMSDLDEGIRYLEDALALLTAPHPGRAVSLNDLANAMLTRFEQLGGKEDLDKGISYLQEALLLHTASHPSRSASLSNLANAFIARFEHFGKSEDLNEGISLHKEALALLPTAQPGHSSSLNNLGMAVLTRFHQLGEREDLDKAIELHKNALNLHPVSHPDRFKSLSNLADAMLARFEQRGQIVDLEEAIVLNQDALTFLPVPHPGRSTSLSNLGDAILVRFQQLGRREDLEEGIALNREALVLRPKPHPLRSTSLDNLATAVHLRFKQLGGREDSDEAASLLQESIGLRPSPHPDRSKSLNNLANVAFTRFKRFGAMKDLDWAITLHTEALELHPKPHPSRSTSLSNLATALLTRFGQLKRHDDLDNAIALYREALTLYPAPHPSRAISLCNLSTAVHSQFKESGREEVLNEAASLSQDSVDTVDDRHPEACIIYGNFGCILMDLCSLTKIEDFFDQAMVAFRRACNTLSSPLSVRLDVAKQWARHAESHNHGLCALEAYETAINLLPRLSSLGHNLGRRHDMLRDSDDLARSAAVCAIELGMKDKAIELLEAGRAVFWSQALQLRTPMDDLREVAPELEEIVSNVSRELDQGLRRRLRVDDDINMEPLGNEQKYEAEKDISHFNHLNDCLEKAIEDVRKLDGFQDFMRPSKVSTLQHAAAANCPIVVLVAGDSECHALIMTSNGSTGNIQHVSLPRINNKSARNLFSKISRNTPRGRRGARADEMPIDQELEQKGNSAPERYGRPDNRSVENSENTFRMVLEALWEVVVEPIIRSLNLEKSARSQAPNIRWCPTGVFSFLPLHAAGFYRPDMSSINSASDYFVSSFIPTIGSLLLNQRQCQPSDTGRGSPRRAFKMMVAIEPKTLPSTILELQVIEKHIPSSTGSGSGSLVKLGVPGSQAPTALIDEVLSHLSTCSIVHFACHGKQCVGTPLESALRLGDGDLKISRIMQYPEVLDVELAFLCACETAMGDENLPDEMMHLGAALLFSGFRGVVATMWSIDDGDGPIVADVFYEYIFRENIQASSGMILNVTQDAPRALDAATANLRSRGAYFKRWVPFIHLGG